MLRRREDGAVQRAAAAGQAFNEEAEKIIKEKEEARGEDERVAARESD